MSGPWEKFQPPADAPAATDGPWNKFKPATSVPVDLQSPDEPENPHDLIPAAKAAAKGMWEGAKGIAKGAVDAVSHPVDTAKDLGEWALLGGGPGGAGNGQALLGERALRAAPLVGPAYDNVRALADDNYQQDTKSSDEKFNKEHPTLSKAQDLAGTSAGALYGGPVAATAAYVVDAYHRSRLAGNDVETATQDARNVMALATAAHGLGKGAGYVAEKAAPIVEDFANNRAASAMGWTKAMRKKLGNDAAETAGRVGLDEGVVTPFASTDDKLERMGNVKATAGKTIGDTMDTLDNAGIKEFNPLTAAGEVQSQIGDKYANEPLFSSLKNQYDNLMETISKRGGQPTTFAEAQKLKKLLGDYGWNEGMEVPGREQARQAYGIVNKNVEGAVDRGAQQLGDPDLLGNLKDAKKNYGAADNTLSALDNKTAAEQGNNTIGLSDTVALTSPHGASKLVAKKLGAKYGQNMMATSADNVAKMLKEAPEVLGKYAAPLAAAAARGKDAFDAANLTLMKNDPAFAALVTPKE